jgi:hypothetical protein
MTLLQKLRAAGARVDGLSWDQGGKLDFVATNANGAWTDEDKSKVLRALGRATETSAGPSGTSTPS